MPDGPSTQSLVDIARGKNIVVLAGLFKSVESSRVYNTYICVDGSGILGRFRKLHPFISPDTFAGEEYAVFDLLGWKAGILICYENNVVKNVRATALLGAEVIFAPYVTMFTAVGAARRGLRGPEPVSGPREGQHSP